MPKLIYLPLEPYKERYTEFLCGWTTQRFSQLGWDVRVIESDTEVGTIKSGRVLDTFRRVQWAADQIAQIAEWFEEIRFKKGDWIYLEDMFHPGISGLAYMLEQYPAELRPKVAVRNYAQSMDPDDFTHAYRAWMRPYEEMVFNFVDAVFCASTCHKELMAVANLDVSKVHVTGLPFDIKHVRSLAPTIARNPRKVVYASRWDEEKNPGFFLNIVQRMHSETEFTVCTGGKELRGDKNAIAVAHEYEERGWLRILRDCRKFGYYRELASAKVQINTARQDFVSFTALEASALGAITLAPAFRSFPETLGNRTSQLFAPWCLEDAICKLRHLLTSDTPVLDVERVANHHNLTLNRTSSVMERS